MRLLPRALCVATVMVASLPGLGTAQDASFVPVTESMLLDPEPGDWPSWRRTLNGVVRLAPTVAE